MTLPLSQRAHAHALASIPLSTTSVSDAMSLFFDYSLDGIANGMILYAALALALVLIYRATRIINFAQGAAGMLTTFIAFSRNLLSRGVGYWWAFVLVLVIGFAIGAACERILIRSLHGRSELNPVIVTIGLLVVFEGLAGAIYGNASRGFPAAFSQSGLKVGRTVIAFSHFDVFILIAVLALMAGTLVLFRYTALGLRMRATAFSREIARLLGVRAGLLPHSRVGSGRDRGIVGWTPCRAHELVQPLLHGSRPRLRVHCGRDRRPREPRGRPRRRAHHGPWHLVRRRVPRFRDSSLSAPSCSSWSPS